MEVRERVDVAGEGRDDKTRSGLGDGQRARPMVLTDKHPSSLRLYLNSSPTLTTSPYPFNCRGILRDRGVLDSFKNAFLHVGVLTCECM